MLGARVAVLEWWLTGAEAPEAAPPDPPTGAAAALQTGPTIRVTWTPPVAGENVDTYAVFRSVNGGAFSELAEDLASPYDDSAVAMGSSYAYKVLARNDAGDSALTAPTATISLPGIVLTAAVSAGPQADLLWVDFVGGETNFSIERRDVTAGGAFAEIDTAAADATTYSDVGPFTAKHRYQYRVVVVGGPSDGLVSNLVTVFGGGVGYLRRRRRMQ